MVGIRPHRIEPKRVEIPPPQAEPAAPPEHAALLKDVVDFLIPLLSSFEAAFYLYFLRHAIVETGQPYARVSMRDLTTKVVRSAQTERNVAFTTVQKCLAGLEKIGAIRKEGGPRRGGSLYRVLLPDEIEACREAKRAARVKPAPAVDVKAEADFYNVRENRLRIFERDGYKCRYCAKQLTRLTATLDHVVPVRAGGGNGWDNLVTACFDCNASKTGRAVGDFLAERASQ